MAALLGLLIVALAAGQVTAKAVFAHFMIGNTAQYTAADFVYDMQLAQQAAIDGFALNMAYNDTTNGHSVPLAFQAAGQVPGFKLFFSFDYAGNGPWPLKDVSDMINAYSPNGAYFRHSTGQPLVSTFEGPKSAQDWITIKQNTGCFFIPDWSSDGARKALLRENGVADGLFNWGAWPEGTHRTNWDLDASYLIFLNNTRTYMAPVSPWFFTNMPGYGKNWLWRGDELWYDRWQQLWSLSVIGADQWPGEPEYLQIISWNDYGESHYIGPLNDKAYVAFGPDYGNAPFNYALGMPHDGWRQMLPYMIAMWKNGIATVTQEVLVGWYRLAPGRACNSGGTTGNNAAQLQEEVTPWSLAQDRVFFAALATTVYSVRVTIGGATRVVSWESGPDRSVGTAGIYYGSVGFDGNTGDVSIELIDSGGGVVASFRGAPISASCAHSVQNWNAWVGSAIGTRAVSPASPSLPLSKQVCVRGSGSKDEFDALCEYTCGLGYCPPGPCTCYQMGKGLSSVPPEQHPDGYPLPGSDCTYLGLCSFACNHGFCPSQSCTTDPAAKGKCIIPAPEPDPDDPDLVCTSGTGSGNFEGLCNFACGRGFCPTKPGPCTCTGVGRAITPPPTTAGPGYPAPGLGLAYRDLCDFACSRGYCPSGACTYSDPYVNIRIVAPSCDPADLGSTWSCSSITCAVASDRSRSATERWNSVGANDFFDYTVKWFGDYNDFSLNPATGETSFSGTSWKDNPVDAIAYFFSGRNAKAGSKYSSDLDCGTLSSNGNCGSSEAFACGNSDVPALDLLLTSFVNIHNFYQTMYDSLDTAQILMTDRINVIAETFYDDSVNSALEIFRRILGAFSLLLTIAGAGFWEGILEAGTFKAVNDGAKLVSGAVDTFTQAFGVVTSLAQDGAVDKIKVKEDISASVREFFVQARSALDSFMKKTFNGNFAVYQGLGPYVKDGLFLDAHRTSSFDFYTKLEPVLTGASIVEAWHFGGQGPGLKGGVLAVIYESGDVTTPSNKIIKKVSDAQAMRVRVQDGDYTLWIVNEGLCGGSGSKECVDGAVKPAGIEHLVANDKENWGITKDDIALSSFYAYMINGKKNIFKPIPRGAGIDPTNTTLLPYAKGVRTPGIYGIPVCSTDVYKTNLVNWQLKPAPCDYYPCCE